MKATVSGISRLFLIFSISLFISFLCISCGHERHLAKLSLKEEISK